MKNGSLHVAVVDIGSLANLGWAVAGPTVNESGTDIDSCTENLAKAKECGPLALGFEAPCLFHMQESETTWTNVAKAREPGRSVHRQEHVYSPRVSLSSRTSLRDFGVVSGTRDQHSNGEVHYQTETYCCLKLSLQTWANPSRMWSAPEKR
jgi:hypothetical protein